MIKSVTTTLKKDQGVKAFYSCLRCLNHQHGFLIGSNYTETEKYKNSKCYSMVSISIEIQVYYRKIVLVPKSASGRAILNTINISTPINLDDTIGNEESWDDVLQDVFNRIQVVLDLRQDSAMGLYGALSFHASISEEPDSQKLIGCFFLPDEILISSKSNSNGFYKHFKMEKLETQCNSERKTKHNIDHDTFSAKKDEKEVSVYADLVNSALKEIKGGNIESVNPSMSIAVSMGDNKPSDFYINLIQKNKAPYNFLIHASDGCIMAGSSPAMFLRAKHNQIFMSPICGTIARGGSSNEDQLNRLKLLNSPKNNAELKRCIELDTSIMNRLCVNVKTLVEKETETFSNVFHTSAYITGRLKQKYNIFNALRYSMWPATVVGKPKDLATTFLLKHEGSPRDWYSGCHGYVQFNGYSDFGLNIRTLFFDENNNAYTRVGSSITKESSTNDEIAEILAKSSLIINTAESL